MPKISIIVSAYNRPGRLKTLLASLQDQTFVDFEVVITDNSKDGKIIQQHKDIVAGFDPRFRYFNTANVIPVVECYWSAEYAIMNLTSGEWIMTPCDDCYYVPTFLTKMLTAASKNNWDLVLCDLIWDCNGHSPYSVMTTRPEICCCGKTSYILKRSRMIIPWPGKPSRVVCSTADGQLIKAVVQGGAPWGKVEEILLVQN